MVVDGFSGAYITPKSTLLWLLTTKGVQLCKLHRRVDFFCKQSSRKFWLLGGNGEDDDVDCFTVIVVRSNDKLSNVK